MTDRTLLEKLQNEQDYTDTRCRILCRDAANEIEGLRDLAKQAIISLERDNGRQNVERWVNTFASCGVEFDPDPPTAQTILDAG